MSKTTTTLSFRCPQDMLDAIDSIGREYYPTDKNSKTNSGCDRSKTLFHIIQAGIAALTDGEVKIEVRQCKTDSNTGVDGRELTELVKKLVTENLQVIQPSNTPSIQNIEDLIDSRIGGSIADGDIRYAIAHSYKSSVDQFNEMIGELQQQIGELKKQVQELQSVPPVAPNPPSADVENLLGIGDILAGNPYDLNYLNNHIGYKLNEHKSQIEAALKIKLNLADPKYICREFNKIVRGLGFTIENKQINKIETYWIVK